MYGKQLCTISLFQLLVWDVYLEASAHGKVQKIKKIYQMTKALPTLQVSLKELDPAGP